MQSPVLTDIKLTFGKNISVTQSYPKDLPDVFKGSSVNILGLFKGYGKTKVVLEGIIKNKRQKYEYEIEFPKENINNPAIPSLWAARRIGFLLDQIRLHGEEKELVDEVTFIARKYGIITPYTSYLIIENEENLVRSNRIEQKNSIISGNVKKQLQEKSKSEYYGMKNKSGEESTRSSTEIQALNDAINSQDTKQGNDRMYYKDESGANKNFANQMKNIQGRAIYQVDKNWIDSSIQKNNRLKTNRIKFAGNEYFKLLKEKPASREFLSLGKNVSFVLDNEIYEIYE